MTITYHPGYRITFANGGYRPEIAWSFGEIETLDKQPSPEDAPRVLTARLAEFGHRLSECESV